MMQRIDILIANKKLVKSRNTASELIKKGLVKVNGEIVTKPAKEFPDDSNIEIVEQPKYVSRGGLKLEKALEEFKINVKDHIAIDIGSSTGGFTDCLLQKGAKKVYAIDVGTNQFDSKLKEDSKVTLMENTDIRNVSCLPETPDLAVVDVSFISLKLVLKKISDLLAPKGEIIALVKPQFETERKQKNKSGVVKDNDAIKEVLKKIKDNCREIHLKIKGEIESPILGGSGNKEYLLLLQKTN